MGPIFQVTYGKIVRNDVLTRYYWPPRFGGKHADLHSFAPVAGTLAMSSHDSIPSPMIGKQFWQKPRGP